MRRGALQLIEYLSAHEQIALFSTKQLSPVDVLSAQIARIEQTAPRINACTHEHFEEALAAARECERRYERGCPRPLEGITVAVKDEYDRRGWKVTCGSVLRKDHVSKENHPLIDKLLAAGAILHVQTTVPEFFLLAVTWSDLWGVTRNPWNLDCTPGGSSGGAAAAVAAGMATLAIGSDMGGSIRIPCALTGLYGWKASYGRLAAPDPSALVPHASPGPLARTLPDLLLMLNVLTGPAPGSPAVLRPALRLPTHAPGRACKIALSLDQGWARLEPDVRANTLEAARLLEQAGAVVEEINLDLATTDRQMREAIEKALFSSAIGGELVELAPDADKLTTYGRRFVELARSMGPKQAKEAAQEALRMYRIIETQVFEQGYDALITPTIATTRVGAGYDPTKDAAIVNGEPVDPYAGWFLASVFNLINWMPTAEVPAGMAENGVPTGLQIACRPYDDETLAEVAGFYAQIAPPVPFDRCCSEFASQPEE
ncbi:MAG: amidase [Xanthobacteraceae bacterium]